jgi:hypothetical protein
MCRMQSRQRLGKRLELYDDKERNIELTEINDELDDLEGGDPLLPPDTYTTRTLKVVPVHDNVNGQV